MNVNSITASELLALRNERASVDVIDVRTPVECREVHAEGARSMPLDRLDPQTAMSGRNGSGAGEADGKW
ncbi:MAG: rhodanese-like domain-containing protein [Phycisphaerales bacterium]|nr:rhodanese-like domain-containing protein [Phycisphaerales bacterium]